MRLSDCRRVYQWANDTHTRLMSFSPDPIPWEEHVAWFEAVLVDPRTHFYIVMAGPIPVGYVRFRGTTTHSTISVAIAATERGKGYGSEAIRLGCKRLFAETSVDYIMALVKPENHASHRAFRAAGFVGYENGGSYKLWRTPCA